MALAKSPAIGPSSWRVDSEAGTLREVLVHRPGRELERITPSNAQAFLYDDVPWPERAAEEHDVFARVLQQQGVRVTYFLDVLADVLEIAGTRAEAVEAVLSAASLSGPVRDALGEYLATGSAQLLAERLVAGVTFGELGLRARWLRDLAGEDRFVLPPLPNQVFVRDSSVRVYGELYLPTMNKQVRARESLLARLVQEGLTAAGGPEPGRQGGRAEVHEPRVEGGDVLVVGNGNVLIGISERSRADAVLGLADDLLKERPQAEVVVTPLPEARWAMHLDTVLTMVDHSCFLVYPGLADRLHGYRLRRSGGRLRCVGEGPLFEVLTHACGVPRVEVLGASHDRFRTEQEQWSDAFNVLALAPGVVVGYEKNRRTNDYLEAAGVQVLTFSGSELGRGRGGPRCMSSPLRRDAAA